MTVKTYYLENDFEEFLSNYDLGEFVYANPISKGTVQTNFLLKTTKAKYVFRSYENRSKESVLFEINLINYLIDKKYPCPIPYNNKHGQFIGICKGKPYVIFEFIEGEHIEYPTEGQKKRLIEKVAELHNITIDYKSELMEYRLNYNVEQCKNLAKERTEKINTLNALEKLKWYINALSELELPEPLPKGVCHCDFHFSNVLFKDGEFNALIDFDDANYTFLIFDLVCLMKPFKSDFEWNTWDRFNEEENVFDFNQAKQVVSEYSRYRPLSRLEKLHLFDVFKLSVLIDCIWYFERGDVIDFFEKRKIDYLNALGREKFLKELFGEV